MSRSLMGPFHPFSSTSALRIRCAALLLAACGFLLGPAVASSQGAGMTLQQGIEVIRQVLAHDGLYARTTTSGINNYRSHVEKRYMVSQADGCHVTVVSDSHLHTELPEHNRTIDRSSSDTWRADFSLMDPASVYVADQQPAQPNWETKGYLVRISVLVGKPPILASTVDKDTKSAHDLPGLPTLAVYVTSREAADRLAKAFTQVATACRANPAGK